MNLTPSPACIPGYFPGYVAVLDSLCGALWLEGLWLERGQQLSLDSASEVCWQQEQSGKALSHAFPDPTGTSVASCVWIKKCSSSIALLCPSNAA